MKINEIIDEKWSAKYKRSIDCSNPKGFSQKAHCAGRKKSEDQHPNDRPLDPETKPTYNTENEARSFAPQVTPLQSLVNEYLFFSSFGTMEAPGDAKSPDSEAKLNDVITKLAQSNKSLQSLDKQKLEANRDKILNHIHDMMKYAIAHLREHLPPEKFDEKKKQINSVLTKYNAAASTNENFADSNKNEGAEITMWTNPAYQGADVDDKYYKKQPVKIVDVSKLTPFEPANKMDSKDNHDNMMKFIDKIKAGEKIKPIVIVPHEGKLLIVDGHHRYFAHLKAGADKIRAVIADPKDLTWRDDVPESVQENFADGKKPGRKGLAKRSGVDCKQPVSKLRSIAKKSSGERARMAHWCANMKAGKK